MGDLHRHRGQIGMILGAAIGFTAAGSLRGGELWPFPVLAVLGAIVGYFAARNANG